MKKINPPAFQLYPRELLTSEKITCMEPAAFGGYMLLLCHAWISDPICSIPNDETTLSKLSRLNDQWAQHRDQILACFYEKKGRFFNKRLEQAYKDRRKFGQMKAEVGSLGAASKWGSIDRKKRSQRLAEARKKGSHTEAEWQEMMDYFEKHCVKCGAECLAPSKDHIIPIYQGGSDSMQNIQPMCKQCNSAKGPENIDYRIVSDESLARKWGIKTPGKMPGKSVANAWPSSSSSTSSSNKENPIPFPSPAGKETKSPFWQDMIDRMGKMYEEKKKAKLFLRPKIFKELKVLYSLHTPFGVLGLWEDYLAMDDAYTRSSGHSIEMFFTKIPWLVDRPYWRTSRKKFEEEFCGPLEASLAKVVGAIGKQVV